MTATSSSLSNHHDQESSLEESLLLSPSGNDPNRDDTSCDGLLGEENDDDDDNNNNDDGNASSLLSFTSFPHFWNSLLSKGKYPILFITVVLLWPLGYFAFSKFNNQIDSTFTPIGRSAMAETAMNQNYENDDDSNSSSSGGGDPILLVLKSTNDSSSMIHPQNSILYNMAHEFCQGLEDTLWNQTCWKVSSSSEEEDCQVNNPAISITSYFSLESQGLHFLAQEMTMANHGRTMLVDIQYSFLANATRIHDREEQLQTVILDYISSFHNNNNKKKNTNTDKLLQVSYTGIPFFAHDLKQATQMDLKRMDRIALPVALVLLGLVLRRTLRFWLVLWIPLLSMLTTVSLWSLLMNYGVAPYMQITSTTPSFMMSLTLGMGIDYTLFLLSCYTTNNNNNTSSSSENNNGSATTTTTTTTSAMQIQQQQQQQLLHNMLTSGGSVVLWSGMTLLCSFLGLVLLPLQMLQSLGVGAGVAILSSLLVNLTLVPVLLHTPLGQWILIHMNRVKDDGDNGDDDDNNNHDTSNNVNRNQGGGDGDDEDSNSLNMMHQENDDEIDDQMIVEQMAQSEGEIIIIPSSSSSAARKKNSFWTRLTKQLLHPYKSVIIFLVLTNIILPISFQIKRLKTSISFDLALPANSPSVQTMKNDLGNIGRLAPYRILFDSHGTDFTMTSTKGFEIMHKVIHQLMSIDTNMNNDDSEEEEEDVTDIGIPDGASWTDAWMETIDAFAATDDDDMHPTYYQNLLWQKKLNKTTTTITKQKQQQQQSLLQYQQNTIRTTTQYNGISMVGNIPIPHTVYEAAKLCARFEEEKKEPNSYCPIETLHTLSYVDQTVTSHDEYATYIVASFTKMNAFSEQGLAWLTAARAIIDDFHSTKEEDKGSGGGVVQIHIVGSAAVANDAVRAVMDSFPMVIGLTLTIVFVLLSLCFQSIVAPIRSILSISMTLGFSFGITTWYYNGTLSWLVPIMSFSIIVGLTLDYDLFVTSRIWECRFRRRLPPASPPSDDGEQPQSHHHQQQQHLISIESGLQTTGTIIVAAGCIMAVAFGAFLQSSCPVLYQWAFLMTCAVLFDTCIVRTIVVPIFLYWTGSKWSWWPSSSSLQSPSQRRTTRSSFNRCCCWWWKRNSTSDIVNNDDDELNEPLLLINN